MTYTTRSRELNRFQGKLSYNFSLIVTCKTNKKWHGSAKLEGKKDQMVGKANLPKQQVIDNVYLKDVDISYVLLIYIYRKKARNFGVSVLN